MGGRMMKYFLLLSLLLGSANAATNKQVSTQEILLGHITTPSNPAAGKSKVYAKSDDLLYILTSGGTESRVGSGDFVGPASSTDNAVCRFDGTTGKLSQNSGVIIDDSNNITGAANISATGVTLSGLTASRVVLTDGSKNLVSSTLTEAAIATLASPTFTGDPKGPTATAGDNDTSIATTAFVVTAIGEYRCASTYTANSITPTARCLDQTWAFNHSSSVTMSSGFCGTLASLTNGTRFTFVGTSDTNTATFNNDDATNGVLLQGQAVLTKGRVLRLEYNSTLARLVEIGRNF